MRYHNLTALFPREFYNIQSAAESNLANWLEFPTELNACPDIMEHLEQVTISPHGVGPDMHYHVFRFRMDEPHPTAKYGWMLGVVGPYLDDSMPYDSPLSTFSRLTHKIDSRAAAEEAIWVHEHISMRH